MGKGVTEEQIRQPSSVEAARHHRHGLCDHRLSARRPPASITETRAKIFRMNPTRCSCPSPLPCPARACGPIASPRIVLLSDNWDDYLFLNKPIIRNDTLTPAELTAWRDNMLRRFYFRPAKLLELAFFFAFRARVEHSGRLAGRPQDHRQFTPRPGRQMTNQPPRFSKAMMASWRWPAPSWRC
jgi:hypothetical protein